MKLNHKDYTQVLAKKIEIAKITLEQYDWPDEVLARDDGTHLTDPENSIYDVGFHAGFMEGMEMALKAIQVLNDSQTK
jgi:hypothetical protein